MRHRGFRRLHGEDRGYEEGPEFWVASDPDGDGVALSLYGELDMASGARLERRLKRLQWDGRQPILIDLSGLHFIDSSGVHVLLRAGRRAPEGQLTLLRGQRQVHRVFEITGTDAQLPFAD